MRRAKSSLAALIFLLGLAAAVRAEVSARPLFFTETWNNITYYDTNLERKGFASVLGRLEGKFGANLFNQPLQLYGVYYLTTSQSDASYNNAVFSGAGLRYYPLESYGAHGWFDEWLPAFKVYYEQLGATYLRTPSSAEASDTQYGAEIWHEWNLDKPDLSANWAETWAKLSVRKTNFDSADFNSYVLFWQQKLGRHIAPGVLTYIKTDLTYSGKDDYWLNTAAYGIGIRFEPWRQDESKNNLFKKLKIFIEAMGVSYLRSQPTDATKKVSTDVRFGLDFSYGR